MWDGYSRLDACDGAAPAHPGPSSSDLLTHTMPKVSLQQKLGHAVSNHLVSTTFTRLLQSDSDSDSSQASSGSAAETETSDDDLPSLSDESTSSTLSSNSYSNKMDTDDDDMALRRQLRDPDPDPVLSLLCTLLTTRTLADRVPVTKSNSHLHLVLGAYHERHPHKFRRSLRMDQETFDVLLRRLAPHPVWHNNSNVQQRPVEYQLVYALYRFSHYSNGRAEDIADSAAARARSCSPQSGPLLRSWVLPVWRRSACTHSASGGKQEPRACKAVSGRPVGVSVLPASLAHARWHVSISLPFLHGTAMFDRKKRYSISVQVRASVPQLRIRAQPVSFPRGFPKGHQHCWRSCS